MYRSGRAAPSLSPDEARTLYNAADALLPPPEGAVALDWAPGVEAALRRRDPAEARRLRRLLVRLEGPWGRVLPRRGFSWQPREARRARLRRRAARRPGDHAFLCALLREAAAAAVRAPDAGDQSTSAA
jgi:hypothetical protein